MSEGKKRGPKPGEGGRPPKLVPDAKTLNQLRGLRQIQCTVEEVASVLGVHRVTLHEFLAKYPEARNIWEAGKNEGRSSLRRRQFKIAEKNPAMAIFLGKQYLGQRDRQELSGPDGGPIPLHVDVSKLSDMQLDQLESILAEALGD